MSSRRTVHRAWRKPSEAKEQRVTPKRRTVFDEQETIAVRKEQLLLPERDNLPFLRLLGQIYDGPNVVELDVHIDDRMLTGIRTLTKDTERRIRRLLRGKAVGTTEMQVAKVQLRIIAVIA